MIREVIIAILLLIWAPSEFLPCIFFNSKAITVITGHGRPKPMIPFIWCALELIIRILLCVKSLLFFKGSFVFGYEIVIAFGECSFYEVSIEFLFWIGYHYKGNYSIN